jgi:hypothetical protein
VRSNAAFVRKRRQQLRQAPVSPTNSAARNYWVGKDFQASIPVSPTSPDIAVTLSPPKNCGKVSL